MSVQKYVRLRNAAIRNIERTIKNYEASILNGERTEISAKNSLVVAQKNFKTVEENHEIIITTCDDEDEPFSVFDEVSDKFEKLQNTIQTYLMDCQKREINNISNLPAQKLPKFDGDPRSWTSFSNTFSSMIGDNYSLTGIQRFRYLIGCLEGAAKTMIAHIPETEDAFDVAWSLLRDRYQDKRFIIMNELDRLTSLKLKGNDLLGFITEVNEVTRKLTMLGEPVDHWNSILFHLISQKLPTNLIDDFENSLPDDEIPPFTTFIQFIEKRAKTIYKREITQNTQKIKPRPDNHSVIKCPQCKFNHTLDRCSQFLKLDNAARWKITKDTKMCANCPRHSSNIQCLSEGKCRTCGKRHHTLLHSEKQATITAQIQDNNSMVLLATVTAAIKTKNSAIKVRALLDSGAQLSFITEKLAKQIGNPLLMSKRKYQGINQESSRPKGEMNITILGQEKELNLTPLVIKNLPLILPKNHFDIDSFKDLVLADPDYNKPGPIEMVLGMDVYNDILLEDRIHRPGELTAQNTIFGWTISGPTPGFSEETSIHHMATWEDEIRSFWDLESIPKRVILSEEEEICEELYKKNTTRLKDGRYSVRLPFKTTPPNLGNSEGMAIKRLESLERRFNKNPEYAEKYREVIHDYIDQGHLELVPYSEIKDNSNYLPHHAVIKKESSTTKYRVVFDASAKTSNGKSLNDELLNGSKLQLDIFHHLLRFRKNPIGITADIEKMYRQISLHPEDRKYQRIVWRDHSRDKFKHYQLTTVTFGLKSAPFLAIRTLHQIAEDYNTQFPVASQLLKNNFYVDNLLTGAKTRQEAEKMINDLNKVMSLSGFHLRQWASNSTEIMNLFSANDKAHAKEWNEVKTLGLFWDTATDTFQYKIQSTPNKQLTKRSLLSIIAGIYDPLGWLSPITIKGKILFQHMWAIKLDWDDPLPKPVKEEIILFLEDLPRVKKFKIPRHASLPEPTRTTLHIFTDASEAAYSAVAYVKSVTDQSTSVQLLTAKTKVAPLKPITIPKMELMAMTLATKLINEITRVWTFDQIFCYSDSKIALAWIQGHPSKWKSFVANRVAQIQDAMETNAWHYVNTADNPADLPTRGCTIQELAKNKTWWNGPTWLMTKDVPNSKREILPEEQNLIDLSQKREKINIWQVEAQFDLLNRYSSYTKLQRVVGYILKWKNRKRNSPNLTTDDLKISETTIIKLSQQPFRSEIDLLAKGKPLPSTSSVIRLSPFLDKDGLLRVGGRLQNSAIQEKHPVLIPKGHIARLLIQRAHQETLHGGPIAILSQLRQKYWVIGARQMARTIIHECPTCKRLSGATSHQTMGPLPATRVQPSRPFTTTAIDYAGPISIKAQGIRTTKIMKGYIVVFVCFATKAIHLELVTDLSTSAFIAALRRFVARRGRPHLIYSDNATNFTGANNELRRLITSHKNDSDIYNMPISPLSNDPNDPAPLTPGHFLIGGPMTSPPDPPLENFKEHTLSRWERIQRIHQIFWSRWSKEYLNTLHVKSKWITAKNPVKVGDLVIVKDPNQPPFSWKLGRVTLELPGQDNITRVVLIKTKDSSITRNITSLIKLETPSERGGRL